MKVEDILFPFCE